MTSTSLKVALVQTDIYWENKQANYSHLEEQLWSIEEDVDLIVLPETFNAGFSSNVKQAEVPGLATQKWMLQMANQKNALIGGSYLVKDGDFIYNRFLFAFPDGSSVSYDKKHLFTLSDERKDLQSGSKKLIVEYKKWKICPMICYDLRFPEWSRNRYQSETDSVLYDILIYSANWPAPRINAWQILLKARAVENQSYVLGVNRVGNDPNGNLYTGQSIGIDYQGKELNSPSEQESIEIIQLEKPSLDQFRDCFPFLKDRDL